MRSKLWIKVEKSVFFVKIKLFIRQLLGTEPKLKIDVVLPITQYFEWFVFSPVLSQNCIVYSMGISDDIDFEIEIINNYGAEVYAFDPTPHCVEWIKTHNLPDKFHFHPWAASGQDGAKYLYPLLSNRGKKSKKMFTFLSEEKSDAVKVKAYTTSTIAKVLGHESICLLKMDIEGAEYDVINSLVNDLFLRPKMILVEFHHRFNGLSKDNTIDAVNKLRKIGYKLAHISTTGREMCFVYLPK